MFAASMHGLASVFAWPNVGLMVLGTVIGMLVGFMPGLGGNFMLAMMIPFVFGMQPEAAFALLLGAHAVVHTGGAISALLFNTPGTGPNAATVFDGYPLVQQGRAGEALGIALTSSAVGGVIGALAMILLIPVVKPIILAFGPPEFFMMMMVGVAFLALMGGKSPVKGLAVGCLGLLLSMVGDDPTTGQSRYTFGWLYLSDGVDQVIVVIGLFAVAEMLKLAQRSGSLVDNAGVHVHGGVWQGIRTVFKYWWLNLRCGVLGAVIGMIPGLGGEVAGFLAYGHAMQSSKTPERFGHGMIEGLIAPESAHNSKEGGGLIPTVAFGVPGSSSMAILLGAFLILGLTPGPKMLQEHLATVFHMGWTIAVANVLGAALGLLFANKMAKLTELRGSLIVPIVLIFAVLGAYGSHNSLSDVAMVAIFGVLGYFLDRFDYPKAPLIMGLVLGKLAEVNLNMSLDLYGPRFLLRPITLALFLVFLEG
ncbi:MAG: tripartite tricarboxylate transporter permease [Alicyclobacillus sp.]|nr:tripartite tricarboxylate transporter permease [Alicyclobacillus sp.]